MNSRNSIFQFLKLNQLNESFKRCEGKSGSQLMYFDFGHNLILTEMSITNLAGDKFQICWFEKNPFVGWLPFENPTLFVLIERNNLTSQPVEGGLLYHALNFDGAIWNYFRLDAFFLCKLYRLIVI